MNEELEFEFEETEEEKMNFIKQLQDASLICGGVEGDVTYEEGKGIMIDNQNLIDAMINAFAKKMREEGCSEEEVQNYLAHPYMDDEE